MWASISSFLIRPCAFMRDNRYCVINREKALHLSAVPFCEGKWRNEGVTAFGRNSTKAWWKLRVYTYRSECGNLRQLAVCFVSHYKRTALRFSDVSNDNSLANAVYVSNKFRPCPERPPKTTKISKLQGDKEVANKSQRIAKNKTVRILGS